MQNHDKLGPARLLANAAAARRRARQAVPESYTQAMAITERRCWLILAKQQLVKATRGIPGVGPASAMKDARAGEGGTP